MTSMNYQLPDEATLAKYMHLLQAVLIAARGSTDPAVVDLAYAVHNLPDLLMRWPDMNEANQAEAFRRFEDKHREWAGHFSGTLERGAPPGWQLKWTRPEK